MTECNNEGYIGVQVEELEGVEIGRVEKVPYQTLGRDAEKMTLHNAPESTISQFQEAMRLSKSARYSTLKGFSTVSAVIESE